MTSVRGACAMWAPETCGCERRKKALTVVSEERRTPSEVENREESNGNPVDSTGIWGSRQTNLIVALFASSRYDCVMLQKSPEGLTEKPLSYVTEIRSTQPEFGSPGKLILYTHESQKGIACDGAE